VLAGNDTVAPWLFWIVIAGWVRLAGRANPSYTYWMVLPAMVSAVRWPAASCV
jgi:hypothetical protein